MSSSKQVFPFYPETFARCALDSKCVVELFVFGGIHASLNKQGQMARFQFDVLTIPPFLACFAQILGLRTRDHLPIVVDCHVELCLGLRETPLVEQIVTLDGWKHLGRFDVSR